jgi:DNA mismatch repair protein MutS2
MGAYHTFKQGDLVKALDSELIGEVVKVIGTKVMINFEYMTMTVPLNQVQRVSDTAQTALNNQVPFRTSSRVLNLSKADFASFRTELDLHGMYVHEALNMLDKWLDKACLLGHKQLRIIHGIGKGILRQEIRNHLRAHQLVKKVIENHLFQGGSGVTVVELY